MRTALLAFLTLLVAAPAAQAAPAKVTWPAERPYAPGERVAVTVSASKAVTASIQRVTANGKVMQTLARRSARRGTVSATLKSAGTYAVRVANQKRTIKVVAAPAPTTIPAPLPSAPVMIDSWDCTRATNPTLAVQLSTATVTAGTSFAFTVQNTGDGCITTGVGYDLEHLQADGTWQRVPWPLIFPAVAVLIRQGETQQRGGDIPEDAEPGSYRLIAGSEPVPFEVVPVAVPAPTAD
jgi:hypothetical protein